MNARELGRVYTAEAREAVRQRAEDIRADAGDLADDVRHAPLFVKIGGALWLTGLALAVWMVASHLPFELPATVGEWAGNVGAVLVGVFALRYAATASLLRSTRRTRRVERWNTKGGDE